MTIPIANNPQDAATPAEPAELADAAENENDQADQDAEESEDQQQADPDDELDEFEYGGKKARIPKWIKPLTMMQADYTRKTTEVAQKQAELDGREKAFSQQSEAQRAHLADIAKVVAYDNTLKEFEALNWDALQQQDPGQANALWMQYQRTKDARDRQAGEIRSKVEAQQAEAQRSHAKRVSETVATLTKEIPGWNPEVADKVTQFGISEFGFTREELSEIGLDARIAKALHRAMVGSQALKAATAAKKVQAQDGVKPVAPIGHKAVATKANPTDPSGDRLSAAEWLRRRNDQLARSRS